MTVTFRLISECVSEAYGIPLMELYSQRRSRRFVEPRRMAWRLARDLTAKSYPEIGRYMGGRDHSAVMIGIKGIEELMVEEPHLVTAYSDIRAAVTALGVVADQADRVRGLFADHDAIEIAQRFLNAGRDELPSFEQIRAMAMGVVHYAREVKLAEAEIDGLKLQQEVPVPAPPVAKPAPIPEPIAVIPEAEKRRLRAAKQVALAFQSIQIRLFTQGEAAARNDLERALKTLSPLFQKDENA